MRTPLLPIALGLGFLLGSARSAMAMPSLGRYVTGTIHSVDAQAQGAIMRCDRDGELITFAWVDRTRFAPTNQVAGASTLRKGTIVEVIRHVPLFGRPFATRVTILSSPVISKTSSPRTWNSVPKALVEITKP